MVKNPPPSNYGASSSEAPAGFAQVITVPGTTVLEAISRSVYVGGAGDLTVVMAGSGATVTIPGVVAGSVLPIRVSNVLASVASGIVIFW